MHPIADMMEALWMVWMGICSSRARRMRSVWVVALQVCQSNSGLVSQYDGEEAVRGAYPKGSPTTRKAMSVLSAPARISSLDDSTMSRSATMRGRP